MQQERETAELTDQKGGKRALHPFVQGVVLACSGGQILRRCGMLIGSLMMMMAVVTMCHCSIPEIAIQSSQRTSCCRRLFDCLSHICPHVHQKLDACMPDVSLQCNF